MCTWCIHGILLSVCCVYCLLCRPHRPLPSPEHDYECTGSGSGDVVLANMTKNPAYAFAGETFTSFSSGTEGNKEEDHTYEEPFEANEEYQTDTTNGGQEDTTDGDQEETADDVHQYVNQ